MILKKTVLEGGGHKTDSSAILGMEWMNEWMFNDILGMEVVSSFDFHVLSD